MEYKVLGHATAYKFLENSGTQVVLLISFYEYRIKELSESLDKQKSIAEL